MSPSVDPFPPPKAGTVLIPRDAASSSVLNSNILGGAPGRYILLTTHLRRFKEGPQFVVSRCPSPHVEQGLFSFIINISALTSEFTVNAWHPQGFGTEPPFATHILFTFCAS